GERVGGRGKEGAGGGPVTRTRLWESSCALSPEAGRGHVPRRRNSYCESPGSAACCLTGLMLRRPPKAAVSKHEAATGPPPSFETRARESGLALRSPYARSSGWR